MRAVASSIPSAMAPSVARTLRLRHGGGLDATATGKDRASCRSPRPAATGCGLRLDIPAN
jgi:hypothetical protein